MSGWVQLGCEFQYELPVVWGHWKRLIKLSGDTDCYYCTNNMTCSIQVCYCPFILVTLSDILFTIISHVHFMYKHTIYVHVYSALHISCFMYTLQTSLLYMHNPVVWLYCILHICMFISITSSLYNNISYITVDTTVDMTR